MLIPKRMYPNGQKSVGNIPVLRHLKVTVRGPMTHQTAEITELKLANVTTC